MPCLRKASVAFTMDTYSHILGEIQGDAMALLDEVLPSRVTQAVAEREHASRGGISGGLMAGLA